MNLLGRDGSTLVFPTQPNALRCGDSLHLRTVSFITGKRLVPKFPELPRLCP